MSRGLDADARSLLRPRRPGAPRPLEVLPPIAASVGVGEWRGPRQGLGGVWWVPSVEATLRMEHGLLTLDLADLIASPATTGPVVHLSGSIEAYYAAGTLIPESDPPRTRPLVGRLLETALVPPQDWPDGAPTLTDGTHAGLAGLGPTAVGYLVEQGIGGGYQQRIHPSRYTGPARALVQAWAGAGLTATQIGQRVPSGWSTAPGALGLAQDPDTHTWWLLECGPGGLRACELAPPALTATVHEWIVEGDLTGADAALAQPYVLADLRPAGDPITLLSAAAMASGPYADGATPIQAGWAWSASGTAGAIVTEYTVDANQSSQASVSRLATVSLSWTGGVPSAALSPGSAAKFRPNTGAHFFWYGSGGQFARLRHALIWPGNDDCDSQAPVVCWYEGEALQVVSYYKCAVATGHRDSENAGDSILNSSTIQDSMSESVRASTISTVTGGFGLSCPDPADYGSGAVTHRAALRTLTSDWLRGVSGDVRSSWPTYAGSNWSGEVQPWKINEPCAGCTPTTPASAGGVPCVDAIDYKTARAEGYEDVATWTSRAGRNVVVYDVDSPDTLWIVGGYTASGEAHHRYDYVKDGLYARAKQMKVQYYNRSVVMCDSVTTTNSAFKFWYRTSNRFNLHWGATVTETTTSRSSVDERQATCRVGGTVLSVDNSGWSVFDSSGAEPVEAALGAYVSAEGAAVYRGYPGADWAHADWDGPLPAVLDSGHGYALAWVGRANPT